MPKTMTKSKKRKSARIKLHFGKSPEALVQKLDDATKNFPMAQRRLTFGFPSATINGKMFAGLYNDKMILRLSPDDAAKLRGAKPFQPMPGRSMSDWVIVPRTLVDSTKELLKWMEKAMAYSKTLSKKKKKG